MPSHRCSAQTQTQTQTQTLGRQTKDLIELVDGLAGLGRLVEDHISGQDVAVAQERRCKLLLELRDGLEHVISQHVQELKGGIFEEHAAEQVLLLRG